MIGYIYGLFDSRQESSLRNCRYIGKILQPPSKRLGVHLREAASGNRTRRSNWIKSVLSSGGEVVIRVLEIHESSDKEKLNPILCEREKLWIAGGRRQGWNLTNGTDGGEGIVGHKHTEETKEKMRVAATGRINSPETRAKMSATHKKMPGRPQTLATRAKLSTLRIGNQHALGHKQSPETKEKLRQVNVGKKASPETRAKMSASAKNRKPSGAVQ